MVTVPCFLALWLNCIHYASELNGSVRYLPCIISTVWYLMNFFQVSDIVPVAFARTLCSFCEIAMDMMRSKRLLC